MYYISYYTVDGAWSPWSEKKCFDDFEFQRRKCNQPSPSNGGSECKGSEFKFIKYEEGTLRDNQLVTESCKSRYSF